MWQTNSINYKEYIKAMCRLFAATSNKVFSPMKVLEALDVMKEGHDGSGMGLVLRDLGGQFEDLKDFPILSGIFTKQGLLDVDDIMRREGFFTRSKMIVEPDIKKKPTETPLRHKYIIRAYEYPKEWEEFSQEERERRYTKLRIEIRNYKQTEDMIVFSFWPDLITIKETGDPLQVGEYLKLDKMTNLSARTIMAQGRQNTNYAINLYACHPFFLNGFSTMTNGENTAFVPIKEYLLSRNIIGYEGYASDSEVFTHILHYTIKELGLDLDSYKHIITPLDKDEIEKHPNYLFLENLKRSCRKMIIDGPNCVIGTLPDNTMFMVQDKKKLRPGIVGGRKGTFAFSSETCGLDMFIPDRNKKKDIQPMHLDTVYVSPDRKKLKIMKQTDAIKNPSFNLKQ